MILYFSITVKLSTDLLMIYTKLSTVCGRLGGVLEGSVLPGPFDAQGGQLRGLSSCARE